MGLGFEGNDSNSQSSTDFKGGKIQKVKKAISESDLECRLIENGILKNAEKRVIKYPPGGFFFFFFFFNFLGGFFFFFFFFFFDGSDFF